MSRREMVNLFVLPSQGLASSNIGAGGKESVNTCLFQIRITQHKNAYQNGMQALLKKLIVHSN